MSTSGQPGKSLPKFAPDDPAHDFDYWFVRLNMEIVGNFIQGRRILELGCFAGLSTLLLLDHCEDMTVVDLSEENISLTRQRLKDAGREANLICDRWENFKPTGQFSDIMMWRGLEHVVDPVTLLKQIRGWLEPRGRLHIVVPNALSLHRRIGVQMGMLSDVHDLNERDHAAGHQRVYDRSLLTRHLNEAGYDVAHWEGIFLKPLSNDQMKAWGEPLIRALYAVGREIPDYCAELYICAQPAA